ncbi:ankyrin repeat protein [Phlyctema vagabunda]|uniref:Ankyrin repeat protein n=1 Tax=Phlyctema vagabunda TaxID=108571 RepID=A0ABR4PP60_9HELO
MATISRALKTAIDLPITDKYRPYKVEALLRGVKPQEALDEALIEEVKASLILNRENTVIATLLAAGADVNAQEAAAIRHALHQPSILDLLLAKQASPASLAMAMPLAMSIPEPDRLVICEKLIQAGAGGEEINKTLSKAVEEGPSALPVMRLVLPKANHDYDGGSALHLAVQHGFVDGLDLLLPHFVKTSPAMKSAVLQEAISIKNKKCRYLMTQKLTETEIPATILAECVSTAVGIQDVAIMELLLAKGAAGEPVTQALIDAIEGCAQEDENPAKLIDIILRFDVDINYKGGLALQKAVQKLNLEIIQKLLPGSNSYSKAMAIPYLFKATSDKATVLQTIEAFSDSILDSEEALDISFKHPDHGLEPVLFMALSHFPRRTQILRALLDLGYNPNQWGLYEVSSKVGPEPWPVLCWAISQPEKRISSANIELLIEEGANVDFTSKSGINPVMLSIQNHRPDVLAALIEKGAKIRVSDDDGVSPLALASQLGNTRVMEHLLVAGADIDDGSLHDAARDLRIDAMRMLVKHGHDVDYPSERHDGRSALAELCLHAVDKGSRSQLEEATQFLIASGSDFRICGVSDEHSGKTIFHYAMDSSDPLKVLQVLLKLPLWKVINDDSFLFKDATYTYSLTKYVEKGLCLGPQSQKEDIVKLLRHKRAQDKFWAHSLDTAQPTDYCGAPKYIDEEVVRQKARQKRLLEEREDAMVAVALKRDTVIEEGKIKIIQTNQEIKRDMEKSRAEVHLLEVKADTELRLHTRAENERQRLARNVQANELTHLKARGTIEAANQRAIRHAEIEEDATRNLMQLEYEDTRISKDNEGVRARMAIEGIAREDQERSQQRHHDRDLARMKMQANILDKSTRLAGQLQGAGMNQRQIGYVVGEV